MKSHVLLSYLFVLLVVIIKAASGISEADRIRMEDPCAAELQLRAGSVSDNLACFATEGNQPDMPQCFNITDICDGNAFCRNGNDEGREFTMSSQINCSGGIGSFDCSSTESVQLIMICDGNKDCSGGEDERFTLCKNKCRGSYYGGCPITRMCNSSINNVICGDCFPGYVTNPNSPTGNCLPVITISFEFELYTVMEGSSQQLEVCAHTTDRIKSEQRLTVNAVITDAVGATPDDYSIPSAMLMGLTLTNTQTRTCINISIIDDQLVEGNETFFVSLRYSEAPGGDQVELGKPNTTTVTIVDNDVISIGFANTCYTISQRSEQANVCLEIVNNVRLSSNFSLRPGLSIESDEQLCTFVQPFVFQSGTTTGSRACSDANKGLRIRSVCYNISLDDRCETERIDTTYGGLRTVRVCENNEDDRPPGFCPAQNASFFGTSFLWQMTPAGTNATFTCPDNTRFSVTRECFSCNRAGIWLEYNERGCGSLTGDLSRILNQSEASTQTSVIAAIQDLARVIIDSANSPVDQTRANLNTTAVILNNVANYVQNQLDSTDDDIIISESIQTVNYLLQWTPTAINSDGSSRLVNSFEVISSVYAGRLPSNSTRKFTFPSITLVAQTSDLEDLQVGRRISIDGGNFMIGNGISIPSNSTVELSSLSTATIPTISLPGPVFERISDTNSTGLVFTLYGESTLFPVGNQSSSDNNNSRTIVGSRIIAANVAQSNTSFEDLQEPIIVVLPLEIGEEGFLVPQSQVCVSWDFNLQSWTRQGCRTFVGGNDTVICTCDHLTNFAVLVDICSRLEDCQPINPVVDTILSFVSYIGITLSIIGLILTIITMLIFKKIRQKDATVYNIQLSIALLLMLVMALVLVAISSEAADILYGGCIFISVSVHYFTLVAVMWMGAAALLMFQKLVMVFVRFTTTQFVIVSLICWMVPIVPVLASLIVDQVLGDDPANDLIVRRTGAESFCFLSHVGVFWGAFLGPILLIMIFNIVIFICVIIVLIRHVRGTASRLKQKIEYSKILRLMFSIGGVMALFGLTWLFAILTVSVPGLREIFQILFTIFNSFQGFFIFSFFCVLNKEARDSWRELFCHGEQGKPHLLKGSSSGKHTLSTALDHEMSAPNVPSVVSTDSKTSMDIPLTFKKRIPSDSSVKSPSESKPGRVLGLEDVPESSTFHLTPSKPTFLM